MKKLNSCAKSQKLSSLDIISVCGSIPIEIPILWPRAVMVGPRPHVPLTLPLVLQILKEDLKKRKLYSRFVPHALTQEQMDERVDACQYLLNMINGDKNFLDKVITGDVSRTILKQSGRAPNGLANILHDRRNCASKNQD